jgi:hypothetical protein
MRLLFRLFVVAALIAFLPLAAAAKQQVADAEAMKSEAVAAFGQILDLWRDGDYGRLYDRTTVSGKETREGFARKMASAQLKPSCCWEKMQEVSANVKSPTSVVIRAKIGLDAPGEMEYKTKSFKMVNEFGEWRIARSEILALAEVKKGKNRQKHHKKAAYQQQ